MRLCAVYEANGGVEKIMDRWYASEEAVDGYASAPSRHAIWYGVVVSVAFIITV